MKNCHLISIVLCLLLLSLASCSKKGDYRNVLPKDAKVVVAIDGKAIMEKASLNSDNLQKLQNKILQLVGAGLNATDYKKIEAGVKSPLEIGLSLTDKIFAFSTTEGKESGLVIKVSDEGKVKDFMKILSRQLGQKMEDQDGFSFLRENDYMLGTNGSALMLLTVSDKKEDLIGYMTVLFKQKAEDSYIKSEYFKKLAGQKGEVTTVAVLSALPKSYAGDIKMFMPADAKLDEVYAVAGLLFEKGRVSIDGECFTTNTALKVQMDPQKGAFGKIKGRFTKSFPLNTPLVIALNMDGTKVSKLLGSGTDPMSNLMDGLGLDIDSFLSSLNGDLVAGINSISLNGESDVTVMAEAKDGRPLNDLKETFQITGRLRTTAPNCYTMPLTANKLCYFGFKNGIMYYTGNGATAATIGEKVSDNLSSASWSGKMEGSSFFVLLNTEALMQSGSFRQMMSRNPETAQLAMTFQDVSYVDFAIADKGKFNFEIIMKDHSVNVLERLVTMLALL